VLEVKLATAIIGISFIHLLKDFHQRGQQKGPGQGQGLDHQAPP